MHENGSSSVAITLNSCSLLAENTHTHTKTGNRKTAVLLITCCLSLRACFCISSKDASVKNVALFHEKQFATMWFSSTHQLEQELCISKCLSH